jgi:hypothetical protein
MRLRTEPTFSVQETTVICVPHFLYLLNVVNIKSRELLETSNEISSGQFWHPCETVCLRFVSQRLLKEELFNTESLVYVVQILLFTVTYLDDQLHSAFQDTIKYLFVVILPIRLESFPFCQLILFNQIEKRYLEVYPIFLEIILPLLKKRNSMENVQMGQNQQLTFQILWECLMDWVFFPFIIVFPYLMKVLTDSNGDGLRDLFFFKDLVERGPAFVVLSRGLLDILDDAPDGVNKKGEDYSH